MNECMPLPRNDESLPLLQCINRCIHGVMMQLSMHIEGAHSLYQTESWRYTLHSFSILGDRGQMETQYNDQHGERNSTNIRQNKGTLMWLSECVMQSRITRWETPPTHQTDEEIIHTELRTAYHATTAEESKSYWYTYGRWCVCCNLSYRGERRLQRTERT